MVVRDLYISEYTGWGWGGAQGGSLDHWRSAWGQEAEASSPCMFQSWYKTGHYTCGNWMKLAFTFDIYLRKAASHVIHQFLGLIHMIHMFYHSMTPRGICLWFELGLWHVEQGCLCLSLLFYTIFQGYLPQWGNLYGQYMYFSLKVQVGGVSDLKNSTAREL